MPQGDANLGGERRCAQARDWNEVRSAPARSRAVLRAGVRWFWP